MFAISIAAVLVTLGALVVFALWNENNVPGSLALDIGAVVVAAWVDWRAWLTWSKYAEDRPPRP
jgi:hypothetical protein